MSSNARAARRRRQAQTFVGCLRQFLTPAVLKQAHQACRRPPRHTRWTLQPLLLVLLTLTWCTGDSQPERFETARGFCVVLTAKRRRPGQTVSGFQKALARLPLPALRVIAAAIRRQFLERFAGLLAVGGWVPFGCDGTRLECPRTAELERHLGEAGKPGTAPAVWLTALVHLPTGLLWSWRLGKGTASERDHLRRLLPTLPPRALVVADAGFTGFELAGALADAGVAFLIRQSSKVRLYPVASGSRETWRDGPVYYWPDAAQKRRRPPLRLRLLRLAGHGGKGDVWLLTSVLDPAQLSLETAGRLYRLRWESEGFFRTYKRTVGKVKLVSRTVALVHREAEGSLLAVQLLLAQGATGLLAVARTRAAVSSPRQILREIRREIQQAGRGRRSSSYRERIGRATRERRRRRSGKEKRPWPRRTPHRPPGAPQILTLTADQKRRLAKGLQNA